MTKTIRNRTTEEDPEEGFTLIELMVVVLIIGILIAIALPTFLGARNRAEDRSVQNNLREALAGALGFYSGSETYTNFDAAAGAAEIPDFSWVDPGPPAYGQVAIAVASGGELDLVGLSRTGMYWCVAQVPGSPVTSRGGDTDFTNVDETAECVQGW